MKGGMNCTGFKGGYLGVQVHNGMQWQTPDADWYVPVGDKGCDKGKSKGTSARKGKAGGIEGNGKNKSGGKKGGGHFRRCSLRSVNTVSVAASSGTLDQLGGSIADTAAFWLAGKFASENPEVYELMAPIESPVAVSATVAKAAPVPPQVPLQVVPTACSSASSAVVSTPASSLAVNTPKKSKKKRAAPPVASPTQAAPSSPVFAIAASSSSTTLPTLGLYIPAIPGPIPALPEPAESIAEDDL